MAVRALLVLVWVAATFAAAADQVSLKSRFPPLPGYTLASEKDEPKGATDIQTLPGGMFTPQVAGRIWRGTYRRAAGAPPLNPLEVMRHYRDALHAAGGIRLMGEFILGNGDANFAGRVPGDRPVWLSVRMTGNAANVSLLIVEEPAPTLTEFPVEPEHIDGRWAEAPPLPGEIEDAEREVVERIVARVRGLLQSTSSLKSPRGFQANTEAEIPRGSARAAGGPIPVEIAVYFHEIEQPCPACPSMLKSGLAHSGLTIHVNNPRELGQAQKAAAGPAMFAVAPNPSAGRGAVHSVVVRFTPVIDFHQADVFDRLRQELTPAKLGELFK